MYQLRLNTRVVPELLFHPGDLRRSQTNKSILEGGLEQIVGRFEKSVLEQLYSEYPSSRLLGKRLGVSHTTIANKLREHDIIKPA